MILRVIFLNLQVWQGFSLALFALFEDFFIRKSSSFQVLVSVGENINI